MSYGLKFTGANNQVIFDSGANNQIIFDSDNFGDAEILTPLSGHPTTSSTSFDFEPSDLVFVRVTGTHTLSNGTAATLRGNVSYSGTTRTLTLSQSTSYFIARRTSSVSGDHTGAGTYGLQIKNSSGDITFSTRKANNSINVIRVFDNFEVAHNQTFFSGSTTGIFVSVGHMFSTNLSLFGCFDFFTDGIKYKGFINAGQFGTFNLPNFGSLIVASIRS